VTTSAAPGSGRNGGDHEGLPRQRLTGHDRSQGQAVASRSVAETVLVGDVVAGDVIALLDTTGEMVVERVQLGHGGFLLTVSPAAGGKPATVWTLTAATRVSRRGRVSTR
jgi:hypothetical protein